MIKKPELVTQAGIANFRRLMAVAADRGIDVQAVALRFALERFLARVFSGGAALVLDPSATPTLDAGTITLKGGLTMCFAEEVAPLDSRTTSDADFYVPGFGGSVEDFAAILRPLLEGPPRAGPDDGVRFDVASLRVARVKDGNVGGGTVTVACQVGKTPLQVRSDLAFDDRPVDRLAVTCVYPSVLEGSGLPPFAVRRTPFSYAVADKLQAMVRHGEGNYRIRDYYDLYVILSKGKADLDEVPAAIAETFALYGSEIPDSAAAMPALSDAFAAARAARWDHERASKHYGGQVPGLAEVVRLVRERVDPLLALARAARPGP